MVIFPVACMDSLGGGKVSYAMGNSVARCSDQCSTMAIYNLLSVMVVSVDSAKIYVQG